MPNTTLHRPAETPSPHAFATGLLLVHLFVLMSRILELVLPVLGVNLRLSLILTLVCLVAAVFTGGLLASIRTPVVVMFSALTAWLMLTVLTSQWQGGSAMMIVNIWFPCYACALLVPSLISNLDQCRKVFSALAFSLVPILLATIVFQDQVQGRDEITFGTLANPNDLAFFLLLLIPFAVFVIKGNSLLNWKTIVCASAIVFGLIKVLRTGSRAGISAIAICFFILFVAATAKAKVKMLGVTALIAVLAFAFLPETLLLRYATIFNGTGDEQGMSDDELSAVASSRIRKMLFEESVRMMVENPVFGVGPGIFTAALAKDQKARGEQETWHEAHNSFTQIGSEAGIPALAIYLALVIYCLRQTTSIYLRTRRDPNQIVISRMAATLAMALVIFVTCGAFGTYSYTFHFPILAGLVQAFVVAVRKEQKTTPAVVPVRLSMLSATTPALTPSVPNYVRNRRLRHGRA